MNQNRKLSFIIGTLVIVLAVVVVFVQYKNNNSGASITTPVANVDTTKTYTLADVATHKTASDCWTTVNGSVYNVTSWIKQHPGGSQTIISMCGIDGSGAFDGQHGGQKRPTNELVTFKIGTLK